MIGCFLYLRNPIHPPIAAHAQTGTTNNMMTSAAVPPGEIPSSALPAIGSAVTIKQRHNIASYLPVRKIVENRQDLPPLLRHVLVWNL